MQPKQYSIAFFTLVTFCPLMRLDSMFPAAKTATKLAGRVARQLAINAIDPKKIGSLPRSFSCMSIDRHSNVLLNNSDVKQPCPQLSCKANGEWLSTIRVPCVSAAICSYIPQAALELTDIVVKKIVTSFADNCATEDGEIAIEEINYLMCTLCINEATMVKIEKNALIQKCENTRQRIAIIIDCLKLVYRGITDMQVILKEKVKEQQEMGATKEFDFKKNTVSLVHLEALKHLCIRDILTFNFCLGNSKLTLEEMEKFTSSFQPMIGWSGC